MALAPYVASNVGKYMGGYASKYALRFARNNAGRIMAYALSRAMKRGKSYLNSPRKRQRKSMQVPGSTMGRYFTYGRAGKFKKRIKAARPSTHSKLGSVKEIEIGGTVSSRVGTQPEDERRITYLGHTTFDELEIWFSMVRAMVRRLIAKDGSNFNNWNDVAPYTAATAWRFDYRTGVYDATTEFEQYTATVGQTYEQIATGCAKRWARAQGGADYHIIPLKLYLFKTGDAAPTVKIDLQGAAIAFDIKSRMVIQNRSLGSVVDADSDVVTDVSNNPVKGRRYFSSSNGLRMRTTTGAQPGRTPNLPANGGDEELAGYSNTLETLLVGGTPNGIIRVTPSEPEFRKPPPSSVFSNCRLTGAVKLNPGQIKTSYLKFSQNVYLTTFFMKFGRHLYDIKVFFDDELVPLVRKHYCNLASAEVFAFEKMLDSRVDEPTISLGYEVHYSIASTLYTKNNTATIPIVDVRVPPDTTEV